jgi:hypothetical protein
VRVLATGVAVGVGRPQSSRLGAAVCDNRHGRHSAPASREEEDRAIVKEIAVRPSRRVTIIRPVVLLAAAAAFSLLATSATAAPTHPPDPASVARAVAEDGPASFGPAPGAAPRPGPVAVALLRVVR